MLLEEGEPNGDIGMTGGDTGASADVGDIGEGIRSPRRALAAKALLKVS